MDDHAVASGSSASGRIPSWLADRPVQFKLALAFGVLLLLFLLAGLAMRQALVEVTAARVEAEESRELLAALQRAELDLRAQQLAGRGFMLSGDDAQREAFVSAGRELRGLFATMQPAFASDPAQAQRLSRLALLHDAWEREQAQPLLEDLSDLLADPQAPLPRIRALREAYLPSTAATIAEFDRLLAELAAEAGRDIAISDSLIERSVGNARLQFIVALMLGLLAAIAALWLARRTITVPIRQMTALMTRLAQHDHSIEVQGTARGDEIGAIARALQVFRQMAIDSAEHAAMRTAQVELNEQLQHCERPAELAEQACAGLCARSGGIASALYLFDADVDRLRLLGSHAAPAGLPQSVAVGEGLLGECARRRETIEVRELPDGYLRIESALGSQAAPSLLALPLLIGDRLVGVVEIALLRPADASTHRLFDALRPMLALSLDNLERADRTRVLLQQTRRQADDLQAAQEAMGLQQEELRATNEELRSKSAELEQNAARLTASEEELRVQAEELHAANEELRLASDALQARNDALDRLQQETARKAAELEQANRYKSEFLANMSHELRTPLNSVLLLARDLAANAGGRLDADEVESAQVIHESGSQLLQLINEILDLARIESGKLPLQIEVFDVADLADGLQRRFRATARERGLDFSTCVEDGLPAQIESDRGRLEQILVNLLGNAFKFTRIGSVALEFGRPPARLSLPPGMPAERTLCVTVADTGIGIAPAQQKRIFEAFEQAESGTARQFGGTGLGLAIARSLARHLGGELLLESEPGHGSRFHLLLPERHAVVAATVDPRPALAPQPSPPAAAPRVSAAHVDDDREQPPGDAGSILVIDDDPVFARVLAGRVRADGQRFLHASTGADGLALAAARRPRGILLDLGLPDMDGWDVLRRLKADPATATIPVHMISARDDSGDSRERGAIGFLRKPVDRESLAAALQALTSAGVQAPPRRVLLVDDDAGSRLATRKFLQSLSADVIEADSAEQALAQIEAMRPDCVVLDLGLPGISGFELIEQLKQRPDAPPVVVYSGRDLDEQETLRLRSYTDSIVLKGDRSPDRLLDEVSLFLHRLRREPAAEPPVGDGLRGRRLLLVDDDMRNLYALSKALRGHGLEVELAQDGEHALALLDEPREPSRRVELVLSDIMMPGMDGYETIRRIRARHGAELPIIALTAKAMKGDRELCLAAGANDYLSKPVELDRLLSLLRVWLP